MYICRTGGFQFNSIAQSCPTLCDPETTACQAPLSLGISQSLLKFMSIELVMLFNHFILCRPLLLLPSIFPGIKVFSYELALHIRWPNYWIAGFHVAILADLSSTKELPLTFLVKQVRDDGFPFSLLPWDIFLSHF